MEQELEQARAEIKALQGKVDRLETDNFKAREARREAEAERDKLKEQVPAEGMVIVSQEDAEALKLYQELGKPEEVKTSLEEGQTIKAEAASLKRSQRIRDAAGETYNAKALERFLPDGAELEQQGEGDKRVWVVKQGDTTNELAEVVKGIEADVGVSLALKQAPGNIGGGSNPGGGQHSGPNPWDKKTRNLTEQARISKDDPELARTLKAQAKN